MLRRLRAQLHALRNKRKKEAELDAEIQFHLSEEADARVASGTPSKEARLEARKDFGNVTKIREATREAWGVAWVDVVARGLFKNAVRNVLRSPRLSFTAVVCIALAMAATSAAVTLVAATLLRPLPFRDADRLARVWLEEPGEDPRVALSYPELRDLDQRPDSFDALEATARARFHLRSDQGSRRVEGEAVTAGYFDLLGIEPIMGRTFSEAEHRDGGDRVVLLSHTTWGAHYGFDPRIIGKQVMTQDGSYDVIGVLPESFTGTIEADSGDIELWVPMLRYLDDENRQRRDLRIVWSIARLAPDRTIAAAQSELDALSTQLGPLFPESYERRAFTAEPLGENWRAQIRQGGLLLLAAAVLVLAVAAGNVALLLLARSIDQRKQWAVRMALGASRLEVARLAFAECAVLVAVGSVIGLLAGPPMLRAFLSQPMLADGSLLGVPIFVSFTIDPIVAVACGLFFLGVSLVASLGPVLQCAKLDVREAIQDSSRSTGGRRGTRWFRVLIATEVALATVLTVGASLLFRSYSALSDQELGFQTHGVLRIGLFVNEEDVRDDGELPQFHTRVREAVLAEPGVREMGVVWPTIPIDWPAQTSFRAPGLELTQGGLDPQVDLFVINAHTFDALELRLVAGRDFAETDDAETGSVAIINRALAREIAGADEKLDDALGVEALVDGRAVQIVGIADDALLGGPKQAPGSRRRVFLPFAQSPRRMMSLFIASDRDPYQLIAPLRRRLAAIAPASALDWIGPVDGWIADLYLRDTQFILNVLGAFALTGLLLSAIGLFAVLADSVARRRGEIGLRQALGAKPGHVITAVVREAFAVVLIGMSMGAVLSWVFRQSLASMLYGVTTSDATSHVSALVVMGVVAALATAIPAFHATAIAPSEALRDR